MDTSEISFCNKIAINILSDNIKKKIIDKLLNKYNITINDKNCLILTNKTFNNIKKNYHLVSVKTIGTQYYLYLTQINNINYCLYIDKKICKGHNYPRIISVKYKFDNSLFKNETLFDGELVRYNDVKWVFLMNNLLVYNNKKNKSNIVEKLSQMYHILSTNYIKDDYIEICPIQIKKYFILDDFDYVVNKYIHTLNYKCNGIYFTPLNIKYTSLLYLLNKDNNSKINDNTYDNIVNNIKNEENNEAIKKSIIIDNISTFNDNNINCSINNKNIDDVNNSNIDSSNIDNNNIDNSNIDNSNNSNIEYINEINNKTRVVFKITKTDQPDIYELYTEKNNIDIFHSIAYMPTLKCSKMVHKLFINNNDNIFIECEYNCNFDKWIPIKQSILKKSDNINTVFNITNKLKII